MTLSPITLVVVPFVWVLVGSLAGHAADQIGPSYPRTVAALRVVAAVASDLKAAWQAWAGTPRLP